jgi:serine/threonine protein kinase
MSVEVIKEDKEQKTIKKDGNIIKIYLDNDIKKHKREAFVGISILNSIKLQKFVEPVNKIFKYDNHLAIQMGLVDGISLEKLLADASEPMMKYSTIKKLAFQLIAILAKCQNEYGLQHNDIYEFNIIVRKVDIQQNPIVFSIGTDKFVVNLEKGDLEITLIDWGGSMINLNNTQGNPDKPWRDANGFCFQRYNSPEELIEPFIDGDENIPRKTPANDMFSVGQLLLTLFANKRWDKYVYSAYNGPLFYKFGENQEISKSSGKGEGLGEMNNINPMIPGIKSATNPQKGEFLSRLKILKTKVFNDTSDINPVLNLPGHDKILNYFNDRKNTEQITFFDGLKTILDEANAFTFIKRLMKFNHIDRLSFGVSGTQYGLVACLYHNYFGEFRKDDYAGNAKIQVQLEFKPPAIYNNDLNNITKNVEQLEKDYLDKYKEFYEPSLVSPTPEVTIAPAKRPEMVPIPSPSVVASKSTKPVDPNFIEFIETQFNTSGAVSMSNFSVDEVNAYIKAIRGLANETTIESLKLLNLANKDNSPSSTNDIFLYRITDKGDKYQKASIIGNAAYLVYGMYVVLYNKPRNEVEAWIDGFKKIPEKGRDNNTIIYAKDTTPEFWSKVEGTEKPKTQQKTGKDEPERVATTSFEFLNTPENVNIADLPFIINSDDLKLYITDEKKFKRLKSDVMKEIFRRLSGFNFDGNKDAVFLVIKKTVNNVDKSYQNTKTYKTYKLILELIEMKERPKESDLSEYNIILEDLNKLVQTQSILKERDYDIKTLFPNYFYNGNEMAQEFVYGDGKEVISPLIGKYKKQVSDKNWNEFKLELLKLYLASLAISEKTLNEISSIDIVKQMKSVFENAISIQTEDHKLQYCINMLENIEHSSVYCDKSEQVYYDEPLKSDIFDTINKRISHHWNTISKSTYWQAEFLKYGVPIEVPHDWSFDKKTKYFHGLSVIASVVDHLDKEEIIPDELLIRSRAEWPLEIIKQKK